MYLKSALTQEFYVLLLQKLPHWNMGLEGPKSVFPGHGDSYLAPKQTTSYSL